MIKIKKFGITLLITYIVKIAAAGLDRPPFTGETFETKVVFNYNPDHIKKHYSEYYSNLYGNAEIHNMKQSHGTAKDSKEITDLDIMLRCPKVIASFLFLFEEVINDETEKIVLETYNTLIDLLRQRKDQLQMDVENHIKLCEHAEKTNQRVNRSSLVPLIEEICKTFDTVDLGRNFRVKSDLQKLPYFYTAKHEKTYYEKELYEIQSRLNCEDKLFLEIEKYKEGAKDLRLIEEEKKQFESDLKSVADDINHFEKQKKTVSDKMREARKKSDEFNCFFIDWSKRSSNWFSQKRKTESTINKLEKHPPLGNNLYKKGLEQDQRYTLDKISLELENVREGLINDLYKLDKATENHVDYLNIFFKDLKHKIDLVDDKIAILQDVVNKNKTVKLELTSDGIYMIFDAAQSETLVLDPKKYDLVPTTEANTSNLACARNNNATLDILRPAGLDVSRSKITHNHRQRVTPSANQNSILKSSSQGLIGARSLPEHCKSYDKRKQEHLNASNLGGGESNGKKLIGKPNILHPEGVQAKIKSYETFISNHAQFSDGLSNGAHRKGAEAKKGRMANATQNKEQKRYTEQKTPKTMQNYNHSGQASVKTKNTWVKEIKGVKMPKADDINANKGTSSVSRQKDINSGEGNTKEPTEPIKSVVCKITDLAQQQPIKHTICTVGRAITSKSDHGFSNKGSNIPPTFAKSNKLTISAMHRMNKYASTVRESTGASADRKNITHRDTVQDITYKAPCHRNAYQKEKQSTQQYESNDTKNTNKEKNKQNATMTTPHRSLSNANKESIQKSIRIVEAWLEGIPGNA